MSEPAPDHVPASWKYPMWEGACTECGTESVSIICETEYGRIVSYDLWVNCSWCHKSYQLPAPSDDED